ncbi:hypothetical protein [Flavobacterium reichenbachii]|uniref:Uncharacterized protein n=1 Tax=Flavobacterium reichenbachii TaxID=362418 RepID=A0A085ZNA6_9FLAO|nr:hypothetical protein [Flavobacterium reichenbachii]KFF05920.1 hypothetical protein IW19_10485 [Flavobacterium reichenbachii]OXB12804.1 hypothetical protein B0A68_18645 [Flavobacterium reichenbachii]
MIEFHSDLGGLWYWILIKFCRTKLSDEQADKNRRRNLFFLSFLNILLFIMIYFVVYSIYF